MLTTTLSLSEELLDLTRYHPYGTDRGTVAWVVDHTEPEGQMAFLRRVQFTVKAQYVEFPHETRKANEAYQRMLRNALRHRRKEEKAARAGKAVNYYEEDDDDDDVHDEL